MSIRPVNPLNEIQFKKRSELITKTIKEETEEEKQEKLQMHICNHLKRILNNYFNEGSLKELSLNVATYTNLKSLFTRSGDIVTIYSSARFDDAALNGGTDYDFAFPLDRLPYDPANDDNGEVYSGIATLAAQVTAPSLGPVQNAVSTIIEPILFGGNLQIRFRITTALNGTDSILQLNFMFSYETNE